MIFPLHDAFLFDGFYHSVTTLFDIVPLRFGFFSRCRVYFGFNKPYATDSRLGLIFIFVFLSLSSLALRSLALPIHLRILHPYHPSLYRLYH